MIYERISKLTQLEYNPLKVYEDLLMITRKEHELFEEILEKIDDRERDHDDVTLPVKDV